ncbi:MAG: oligopeptide transporter, OPT family [Planctomycetota bacterium]|jgi:putative OPT family oligopeptide transporter|nr:oligopeptide transporter, OPT family [Planctomycetota bacterium]
MTGTEPLRNRPLTEITALSLGLGVLVGLVMSVANVYLGLFAGMTVSASIPAAVISMGILKGVLRRGTIHENNIVQTVASAGESLAAGIIFTMPALVIAGVWSEFDYWTTTLVSVTGGLLGVLFMIPLRKPMIVESEELIYPEGVACAKVLQAGESGGSGMKMVFGALGLGALLKLLADAFRLLTPSIGGNVALGRVWMWFGSNASPALLGVGWIVGFNIAALVFVGGALSWLIASPVLQLTTGYPDSTEAVLGLVKSDVKFLGVGAMIVGGLWSILQIRSGITRGIQETFGGYRASMSGESRAEEREDMSPKWLLFLIAATALVVAFLYMRVTNGIVGVSFLATILMTVCSFFFVAVAAYIVGLVGSSNSPVSGMTICSVLLTSGFVALFGFSGETAILATMGVAGVVCCATCTSGDVCQDLKTGHLVGATPFRQQWAEVLGVLTASFVMAPVLGLLHRAYGIGTDSHLPLELQGQALEAPQAGLFASLMDGFFGEAELPWNIIAFGMLAGLAIILVDQMFLRPKQAKFRLHVMPVAVGMYLPFGLSTAILLGGLLSLVVQRSSSRRGNSAKESSSGHERGVLLASGLIAGEAIAGVLIAIPKAQNIALPDWSGDWSMALSSLGVLIILSLFLRSSRTEAS